MKWVFVFLLAVNFAFLGWQLKQSDQKTLAGAPSHASLPPETGNLKLLSELNKLPPPRHKAEAGQSVQSSASSEGAVEQTAQSAPSVPGSCFSIGPFESEADAEEFNTQHLADRVSRINKRPDEGLKKKLFWVYLAPENSEQTARQKLQDLQREGVKDSMLIHKGGLKNAISLGVYSSQEAANRRLAELGKKGYQPVVVPRYQAQTVYWIGLKLTPGESLPPSVSQALPSGVQAESAQCSKIALDSAQP